MPSLDGDLSELYGLSLGEFTEARNELAKKARKAGDDKRAEEIAKLKKPTLVAWALNMLPRLQEAQLRELLRAGEQAERAQAETLSEGVATDELPAAREAVRRRSHQLARDAGEILVKGGHAAREETLLRIATALESSVVTDEGRQALLRGTFTEEPQPAGFDLFAQLAAGSSTRSARAGSRKRADERAAARKRLHELRTELRAAGRERAELDSVAQEAERLALAKEREANRARRKADAATERAEQARSAEQELAERLAQAEQRLG